MLLCGAPQLYSWCQISFGAGRTMKNTAKVKELEFEVFYLIFLL